ncbi:hypothetical protein T492DRAFT_1032388, partial [Pavlovales sp. CCMP2436]
MGCLAKLLYALLSATSITDASFTTSSTAPPRGCSRHARANKFTAFQTQTRHQVDSSPLRSPMDSLARALSGGPALRSDSSALFSASSSFTTSTSSPLRR